MKRQKRGISDLIATVLLVLIVLGAVALIWQAVVPFFKKSLDKSLLCSQIELSVNTETGNTWYDDEGASPTKDVSIKITADKAGELNDIQIKIRGTNGSSAIIKVKDDLKADLPEVDNEDRTYKIAWSTLADKFAAGEVPQAASLAAMVLVSGKKETCSLSMEVNIPAKTGIT